MRKVGVFKTRLWWVMWVREIKRERRERKKRREYEIGCAALVVSVELFLVPRTVVFVTSLC